jgi:hypothetical protein
MAGACFIVFVYPLRGWCWFIADQFQQHDSNRDEQGNGQAYFIVDMLMVMPVMRVAMLVVMMGMPLK